MTEAKFQQLRDKTVIITGGAGRIGSATARACLSLGANVVITDISSSRLKQFENNLPKDQLGRAHTLTGNITEESNIVELIKKAVKIAGPINAAVHSAYPVSKGWGSVYEDLDPGNLYEDLANQMGGAILFSKQIIKHFRSNSGGDLIHVASIQGISAPKFEHYENTSMTSPIEYTAIKSGIIGITRWLAKYHANQNIRVNCVSPGGIKDEQPRSFLDNYRKSCTNIGMLTSDQVASTIAYLLTPGAKAINGQNIIIDDGWSL